MIELLTLLVAGHFLADFGLQSDFIARNKHNALSSAMGFFTMTAHAMIHGLITTLVVIWFGHEWFWVFWIVTITHWLIDFGKCRRWYGITVDQLLHIGVLVVVAVLLLGGVDVAWA